MKQLFKRLERDIRWHHAPSLFVWDDEGLTKGTEHGGGSRDEAYMEGAQGFPLTWAGADG